MPGCCYKPTLVWVATISIVLIATSSLVYAQIGPIEVTRPVAGNVCYTLNFCSIAWKYRDLVGYPNNDIIIELWRGTVGGRRLYTISSTASNDGFYSWLVDKDLESGTDYNFKLINAAATTQIGVSPTFTIEKSRPRHLAIILGTVAAVVVAVVALVMFCVQRNRRRHQQNKLADASMAVGTAPVQPDAAMPMQGVYPASGPLPPHPHNPHAQQMYQGPGAPGPAPYPGTPAAGYGQGPQGIPPLTPQPVGVQGGYPQPQPYPMDQGPAGGGYGQAPPAYDGPYHQNYPHPQQQQQQPHGPGGGYGGY